MMKQRLTKKHKIFFTQYLKTPQLWRKETYPTKEENLRISSRIRRQMAIISHIFPHPHK